MDFLIGLGVGLFLGANVGFMLAAILYISSKDK